MAAEPIVTPLPKLQIKKVLTLPEAGVTTPNTTFTFTATPHSFNNDTGQTGKLPQLAAASVSYTNGDVQDNDGGTAGKQIIKASDDLLNGVPFTEAGQYTYLIKEVAPSQPAEGGQFRSSLAEYKVSLFVSKQLDESFKVTSIMIAQTKMDDGNSVGTEQKTAYSPSAGATGTDNNFKFENSYDKEVGNAPPTGTTATADDKKGFVVTNTVKGNNTSTTQDFTFKMTITKPVGSKSTDQQYTMNIVDANGQVIETKKVIQNYEEAVTFTLKAGERLVVSDVLLGSKAIVEETKRTQLAILRL
ncbi:hypothetical protein D3X11_04580 [Streptococcus sp. X16XC17]|nr:hypothetical protein D3X11_04580 [Streptococcus sp. X16XC17]